MDLLLELLDRAGVDYRNAGANEVTLCCPFCPDGDTKFHFGLNTESGLAHCFKCDWRCGGLLETARQLSKAFEVPFTLRWADRRSQKVKEPIEEKEIVPSGLPTGYERFTNDPTDKVEKRLRSYLRSRGVSTSQIVKHKIGYAAAGRYAWRVLFPVFGEDGKVYGCVARSVDVKQKPKYLNTPGIKLLWNGYARGSVAVITEGVLDALNVEKALLRRRDWVAVARLGSTLTEQQLRQLRAFERLVVLPDSDVPGVRGAVKLCQLCEENYLHNIDIAIPQEMDGRDPGDMSEDELSDYIDSAQRWNSSMKYRMRMVVAKGA